MSTKWKERNSRKNRKNRNHLWNRDLRLKDDGQEYGRVLKIFGNRYVLVFCSDNKQRVCRIRGRLRKNVKVRAGGIVLVELRDYQDYKGDIIYKYTYPEAQLLKKSKKVPLQPTTDECPLLVYGQIARVLSKDRVLAFCVDGKQRVCRDRREHAYGKNMLMARGDIIVIECSDHQDFESDIIHKCAPDEAQRLKDAKILPDHIKINNGALLEYGRVTQKLHNRHVLVQCFDGEQRICRIQGKRGKRTTAGYGQTVLVGLRDREDSKGIILHQSKYDEAQRLMENNKLPGAGKTGVQKKEVENKEVMIHSENLGEEQVRNNMPSGGNGEGPWHPQVGASRTRREGMPWARYVEDRNVVKGLTRAQNKRVIPSVDPAIEEKRILMKMSLMKILLECEENNIYVPPPSTTTPTKTTPSKEDILGQLMENQILKHELLQKKCRLADMQIEYFARQLERESKG